MTLDAQLLRSTWAVERMKLQPDSIAFSLLPFQISKISLCASVSNKGVAILIPVSDSDVFGESRDSNIEFARSELDCGQGVETYLQLTCLDETLEKVFSNLCADLINEVLLLPAPGIAARQFFDKWRVLFARSRNRALSNNALIGLFGELRTMHQIAELDPSRTLHYWVGPDGAPQDFTNGESRIEVKSTSNLNELKVAISSVHQLADESLDSFHLVVHRIVKDDSGLNISELIQGLLKLGVDRISLYEKLSAVGYDWADPDLYKNERFKLLGTYWFLISEDFPRIVPHSFKNGVIPDGVEEITYSINLGSGSDALGQVQVSTAIKTFIEG